MLAVGMSTARTQNQTSFQAQKQNVSFGAGNQIRRTIRVLYKEGKVVMTASAMPSLYAIFSPISIALLKTEFVARGITHASKLAKNMGLIKNSVDLSANRFVGNIFSNNKGVTFMEDVKKSGQEVLDMCKNLGLKKTEKVLGIKLW